MRSTFLFFFPLGCFRTVTFENLMEFRCKVEGDEGEVAVKTESDFFNVGLEKDGEEVGLGGGENIRGGGGGGRMEEGGSVRPS